MIHRHYLISQLEGAQIIHRKGNMHCNADYLSRSVLLGSKIIDLEESKLDPWENSALMYYLKFKKFPNGTSRKQVNRIKQIENKYEYDPDKDILFIFKKEKKLIVPERVKREEIIDKEHSASVHFGVDSTAGRIKERYWWR